MKVCITGGRDYADRELVWKVLSALRPQSLAHGDCKTGVDAHAQAWSQHPAFFPTCSVARYPANWDAEGKPAGPIRNRRMLREFQPDLVVAFPGGRGTNDCVDTAKKMGIVVLHVHV